MMIDSNNGQWARWSVCMMVTIANQLDADNHNSERQIGFGGIDIFDSLVAFTTEINNIINIINSSKTCID